MRAKEWNATPWHGGQGQNAQTGPGSPQPDRVVFRSGQHFTFGDWATGFGGLDGPWSLFIDSSTLIVWYRHNLALGPPPVRGSLASGLSPAPLRDYRQHAVTSTGGLRVSFVESDDVTRYKAMVFNGPNLLDGDWHNIIASVNVIGDINGANPLTNARFESAWRVWIDGEQITSFTPDHGNDIVVDIPNSVTYYVGGSPEDESCRGWICEPAILSSTLPPGQQFSVYNQGVPPKLINAVTTGILRHYWRWDAVDPDLLTTLPDFGFGETDLTLEGNTIPVEVYP